MNIIYFPEFRKLKEEVDQLTTELENLILEYDELRFVICKNIEAKYIMTVGVLEFKNFELMNYVLRLRRKIELIIMKKNRQEQVNIKEIEAILNEEHRAYEAQIEENIRQTNKALQHHGKDKMTELEKNEFKGMYKDIVKTLHPDINQNASTEEVQLFKNAVEYYKRGNFEALKTIHLMVRNKTVRFDNESDSLSELRKRKNSLNQALKQMQKNINEIKKSYPYNTKELLDDAKRLQDKIKSLETIQKEYESLIQTYDEKIKELLR